MGVKIDNISDTYFVVFYLFTKKYTYIKANNTLLVI